MIGMMGWVRFRAFPACFGDMLRPRLPLDATRYITGARVMMSTSNCYRLEIACYNDALSPSWMFTMAPITCRICPA